MNEKQIEIIKSQLHVHDGRVTTTSLAIAEAFDKQHKHVLRDIQHLECSEEFARSNFGLSEYKDPTGRKLPMYNITRDGFVFLVMGYQGRLAARLKEAYILAFNRMEQELRARDTTVAMVELERRAAALETELLMARPLWKALKRYKNMGLNHAEIGKLCSRASSTIRKHVRRMENCGLVAPAPARQMRLFGTGDRPVAAAREVRA